VIKEYQVTDLKKKIAIMGKVSNQPGRYVATDNAEALYQDGCLKLKDGGDAHWAVNRMTGSRQNLQDPFDPTRLLLCEGDTTRQTVTVKTANGDEIWEYALPPTDDNDYRLSGILGRDATTGKTLIVIAFNTQKVIAEYNSKVQETHIYVFSEGGTLKASVVFPPNGDIDIFNNRIMIVCANDGENELMLLEKKILQVYAFKGSERGSKERVPKHDVWQALPQYTAPAKNLWSVPVLTS
jgi:hypothetical protein